VLDFRKGEKKEKEGPEGRQLGVPNHSALNANKSEESAKGKGRQRATTYQRRRRTAGRLRESARNRLNFGKKREGVNVPVNRSEKGKKRAGIGGIKLPRLEKNYEK